jgi:hypothetical protein
LWGRLASVAGGAPFSVPRYPPVDVFSRITNANEPFGYAVREGLIACCVIDIARLLVSRLNSGLIAHHLAMVSLALATIAASSSSVIPSIIGVPISAPDLPPVDAFSETPGANEPCP